MIKSYVKAKQGGGKTMARGGKRDGAGRPTLSGNQKKVAISIKLPSDLIFWMDKQALSRAKLIEIALREKHGVIKL